RRGTGGRCRPRGGGGRGRWRRAGRGRGRGRGRRGWGRRGGGRRDRGRRGRRRRVLGRVGGGGQAEQLRVERGWLGGVLRRVAGIWWGSHQRCRRRSSSLRVTGLGR